MMKRAHNPSSMQKLTQPLPVTPPAPATNIARIYEVTVISAHRAVFALNSNPASQMTAALRVQMETSTAKTSAPLTYAPRRMSASGWAASVNQPSFMDSVATEPVWTVPMTTQVTDVVQRLLGRPGIAVGRAVVLMPVPAKGKIAVFLAKQAMPSAP